MAFPRITFGIIVLNGEPFTRYCLRSLYPFAYQIIVVEGAAKGAVNIATEDGHSVDGTLETLRQFKETEDPENKVEIVTRNGFWNEKDEMSQAYAVRAAGDYLWQVDIDEFYKSDDMRTVIELLRNDPSITAISFEMITFWGGFGYLCDGWYLKRVTETYHRIFKWGEGYQYITHRPPTVQDTKGRDLRLLNWIDGHEMVRQYGIIFYHYSLVFPKQVLAKSNYYRNALWAQRSSHEIWANDVFLHLRRPYNVHNVYEYPSWLERFTGVHPEQIQQLIIDIDSRQIKVELRKTKDIELLLHSPLYLAGRGALKFIFRHEYVLQKIKRSVAPHLNPKLKKFIRNILRIVT